MFDPAPSLLTALVLGLGPAPAPVGELVEPQPPVGEPCVAVVPALYRGGPLDPCPEPPPRPTTPQVVPLELPGRHSASDE